MFFGECMTSWSTPSTRNRTRTSRSVGSMWTSEARSPTACVMIAWTSLTMGASSRAASICSSSVCSCSDACDASASTWPSMPANFWIACSTSAAVATTGCTSRLVIVRMSSSAYTLAGSDMATSSFPSRSPIGIARYRRASASGSSVVAAGSMW